MAFKVTISGDIKLEKCIESVVCRADLPSDCTCYSKVDNYMYITGKISSNESTAALYQWALLRADNPNAYRKVIVEEIEDETLIRKVIFDKAFVLQYEENYSINTDIGSFGLHIKQLIGNKVQCTNSEIQSIQSEANNIIEKVELVKSTIVKEEENLASQNIPFVMTLEPSPAPTQEGGVLLNVPFYSQASDNIVRVTGQKNNGCTLTACSMAYDYKYGIGKSYNSDLLSKWWGPGGMYFGKVSDMLKSGPFISIDYKTIYEQLNKGNPVIFYVKDGSGKYYAHAVVIKGYVKGTTVNNLSADKFLINDPGKKDNINLLQVLNKYATCKTYRIHVIR